MAGKKKNKRTPAAPLKKKVIVVGVTDMRVVGKPGATLPIDELQVKLVRRGITFRPKLKSPGNNARASARFEGLTPGTYKAWAYRKTAGDVVATAMPKDVTLRAGPGAAVDLHLHAAAEIVLLEARFLGDQGVIVPTPPSKTRKTKNREMPRPWQLTSNLGDSIEKTAKPEYKHNEKTTDPTWHAASYLRGKHLELELKLQAKITATTGTFTLEEVGLVRKDDMYDVEVTVSHTLSDNARITVRGKAKKALPNEVSLLKDKLFLFFATVNGYPARIRVDTHKLTVITTLGTPAGKVSMHGKKTTGVLFPETGSMQSITKARMALAAAKAAGAKTEEQVMRKLFENVTVKYYPAYYYPTGSKNTTVFKPAAPPLHEYLWIALAAPNICHCMDLAASFRLAARILGVGGKMTVAQLYPWAPWDAAGTKRDLTKKGEPGAGALKRQKLGGGFRIVFIDAKGWINRFEAVTRWVPSGTNKSFMYPVGEAELLNEYDKNATVEQNDAKNAHKFFAHKSRALLLGVSKKGKTLRRPAFRFLDNDQQTLFQFHYTKQTFKEGDDRGAKNRKLLEPKKK